MSTVDLDALVAALDPDGRGGRRHVDDVAAAIRTLVAHVDAAAVPELVRDTIRRGEQHGHWSSTRTATVQRGRTTLPKSVILPAAREPPDKLQPAGVPLRDELASWAATLRLSASQRQLIVAVNDWLRRTDGGNVPVIAAAERAYELTGDEKAFDAFPPRGGQKLWGPGRLTLGLLRCERTATPLTWEPTITVVGEPGPVVCVENHATFRTLLRVLRAHESPHWVAVAWVQGRNIAPLESLADLPFAITRLDYLGDLDATGLAIAASACAAAQRAGVPAGPATRLWALLVEQPARAGHKVAEVDARGLAAWLPEAIRDRACALLLAGRAIPQEALRYDMLADSLD
ncbi:MAG: hypothetical protein ACRDQA_08810 [Nocardioidaceae bacterium]